MHLFIKYRFYCFIYSNNLETGQYILFSQCKCQCFRKQTEKLIFNVKNNKYEDDIHDDYDLMKMHHIFAN